MKRVLKSYNWYPHLNHFTFRKVVSEGLRELRWAWHGNDSPLPEVLLHAKKHSCHFGLNRSENVGVCGEYLVYLTSRCATNCRGECNWCASTWRLRPDDGRWSRMATGGAWRQELGSARCPAPALLSAGGLVGRRQTKLNILLPSPGYMIVVMQIQYPWYFGTRLVRQVRWNHSSRQHLVARRCGNTAHRKADGTF